MVQGEFVCKNDFVRNNCGKLYLNSATADVFFELNVDTEDYEQIPAHKILLSIGSPVFETMFYGSLKEKSEIPIVDASAAAFKVFLSFFYLSEITLDPDYLAEVTNLCKKYELSDCLKSCEMALIDTLTNDDMCWGYRFGLLMEQEELVKFCEQKIQENPAEILKTDSFLECNQNVIKYILRLVHSECEANLIVDASMVWAKAECKRKDLNEDSKNLKDQLGEAFKRIPFDELTFLELAHHTSIYRGFFSIDELETIIQEITIKPPKRIIPRKNQIQKWTRKKIYVRRKFICQRVTMNNYLHELKKSSSFSDIFYANENLRLTEIYFEKAVDCDASLDFIVKCYNTDKWVASGQFDRSSGCAKLASYIDIEANRKYVIILQGKFNQEFSIYTPVLEDTFELIRDIEIHFEQSDYGAVTRLVFESTSVDSDSEYDFE